MTGFFGTALASGAFEPTSSLFGHFSTERVRQLHSGPYKMQRLDRQTYVMTACEGGIVDPVRIDQEVEKIRSEGARVIVDGQATSACILFLEALALTDGHLVCATDRAGFSTHAFIWVDQTDMTRWAGYAVAPHPNSDEIAHTINLHRSAIMRSWLSHNRQWLTFTDYVELPQAMMFALLGRCSKRDRER